jgi:hypothetical protein
MPRKLTLGLVSLYVLLPVGLLQVDPLQAQENPNEHFAQAQKQNAAQLRQYSWTSRTALKIKDEVKNVKYESVRYDANGQLQKTPIEPPPVEDQPEDGDRAKKKVGPKPKQEFTGLLKDLAQLAQSYTQRSPAQMQSFAQGAAISNDTSDGTVVLEGRSAVVQGDVVRLHVDPATFLIRQVNLDTLYQGNPVKMIVAFGLLSDGPSYPSQVILSYPKKKVEVIVKNTNYQHLRATVPEPATPPVTQEPESDAAQPYDGGWPRKTTKDGATLITYQPQVDDWKDFKTLNWRMAFSLAPKGGKAAIGAISIEAQTDVDHETHTVLIHDLKVERTNFPSLQGEEAEKMDQLVRSFLPPTVTISLERIVAASPKPESEPTVQLKNDPPQFFVSYKTAILLDVNGEPVMAAIPNTSLEYIINTAWSVFRDKADSHYYLLAGETWMTSTGLKGPWSAAKALPNGMDIVKNDQFFSAIKDFIPLQPAKPDAIVPEVFYSTVPAEMILFDGQPAYKPIPGTQLSYANNTMSYVFLYAKTNEVYHLTQGRWFSAKSLDGPWTFATPDLPEDFARIPQTSPASQVLASVPGTGEAKDAVLLALVPTTAVVDPKAAAAAAKVTYDGEPKFAPIEGTSMHYATNTGEKVIRIRDVYYLCLQGVWFFASTPQGPWQTAPSAPKEVQEIPPSSPVYNVTYVAQETLSDGSVEASYTSGYMGAFVIGVTAGAIICGGTGYYYPPYVGFYGYGYPYYYPYPYTYGGAAYYNSATGRYGVSQSVYGPYGSATRRASYNPYTGTYGRSGTVATPYGRVSGGQAYNPYTGAYGATRQGSNAYSQWGSSVVSKNGRSAYTQHYSGARGTVGSIQGSQGGAAVGAVGRGGNSGFAGKTAGGDVYAGRDGNVYKNTGSGWQKYDNGNWNSVNNGSQTRAQNSGASRSQTQSLQSEAQSRSRGAQSSQRYQQRSGGYGGGGARGGGRRR